MAQLDETISGLSDEQIEAKLAELDGHAAQREAEREAIRNELQAVNRMRTALRLEQQDREQLTVMSGPERARLQRLSQRLAPSGVASDEHVNKPG